MRAGIIVVAVACATAMSGFAVKPDDLSRYGGMARLSGKGHVALIDCRKSGEEIDFATGTKYVSNLFGISISYHRGRAFSLANASAQLQETGGNVAVFVADDPALPMSLSAPEARWAMLNASRASADAPEAKTLCRRLSLLFIRQCCRVLGSDESFSTDTCFHSVFGVNDLDAITSYDLPMGPEMSIPETMTLRGIEKIEYGTYEEACMTGVAPPPTNDVQKAIWEKVHAIPKNPIKIEFDPKKGR